MRELPDSIPPRSAMALLPDRGTSRYEERVVGLEPAAGPHASGRDVDLTEPASACECGVGCGVLPDAAEASVAENRAVVVSTRRQQAHDDTERDQCSRPRNGYDRLAGGLIGVRGVHRARGPAWSEPGEHQREPRLPAGTVTPFNRPCLIRASA
jgi:hypothetical protein